MSRHGTAPGSARASLKPFIPWGLALLSGIMTGGCFPPWDHRFTEWLPWVALAPLCWAVLISPQPACLRARAARSFLLGWITGFVSFLISLHWITTVTWPGWIALSLVVGCYHAFWGLYAGTVLRALGEGKDPADAWLGSFRNFLVAILAAAGWTAVEWLRGTLFSGFGWNSLGVALRENIPLIQIAGITGTAGLTFLCMLIAATAAITLECLRREIVRRRARPHIDFFAAIFLVALAFGYGVKKLTAPAPATEPLRVACVQGNVPVYDYWDPKCEKRIMEGYVRQTRVALASDPDLVVWPEAATPKPLLLDEIIYSQVKKLAEGTRADFLIGSVHYEAEPRGDYNSAILLTGHASSAQIYNKVHLVPFGEFVPFRKLFPPLGWVVGDRVPYDFDPGKGPAVLDLSVKPMKVGPLICFEDTVGDLTRGFAVLGARLLVTLTNDGWFERSIATRQHLANAQLRTVETGLPLLRVADTGVTCLVDRFGRLKQILRGPDGNTFIEGILHATVPVPSHPETTFYTRHGDLFAHACLALTIAATLAAVLRRIWRVA